jgi:ABC-type hemin transport system substrate-binding protein
LAKLEDMQAKVKNVMSVLNKPEVGAALRQDKSQNLEYLKQNYNVIYFFSLAERMNESNHIPFVPLFCRSLKI